MLHVKFIVDIKTVPRDVPQDYHFLTCSMQCYYTYILILALTTLLLLLMFPYFVLLVCVPVVNMTLIKVPIFTPISADTDSLYACVRMVVCH